MSQLFRKIFDILSKKKLTIYYLFVFAVGCVVNILVILFDHLKIYFFMNFLR